MKPKDGSNKITIVITSDFDAEESFQEEKLIIDLKRSYRTGRWAKDAIWTRDSSNETIMKVHGMSLTFDNNGNWSVEYDADVYVDRHRWVYHIYFFTTDSEKELLEISLPELDKNAGLHKIKDHGFSSELREKYSMISRCRRKGGGAFTD